MALARGPSVMLASWLAASGAQARTSLPTPSTHVDAGSLRAAGGLPAAVDGLVPRRVCFASLAPFLPDIYPSQHNGHFFPRRHHRAQSQSGNSSAGLRRRRQWLSGEGVESAARGGGGARSCGNQAAVFRRRGRAPCAVSAERYISEGDGGGEADHRRASLSAGQGEAAAQGESPTTAPVHGEHGVAASQHTDAAGSEDDGRGPSPHGSGFFQPGSDGEGVYFDVVDDNLPEKSLPVVELLRQKRSRRVKVATAIEVREMSKHYNTKSGPVFKAVDGASMVIEPGSLVALLGPSGSGKTTLLRLIAGLEEPTGGRLFFDGEDVTWLPVAQRNIGFMFQNYALFKHMTVAQNIGFGLMIRRKPQHAIDAKVTELLELVQLPHVGNRFPTELSGGQRQRIALARALAYEPKVLLLDEPFGALDAVVRKDLRRWLRELHDELGLTTLFVTHDQEEAMEVADTIAIFNRGKVVQVGSPQEVYEHPATPFAMNFMGEVNSLPSSCLAVRNTGLRTSKGHVLVRPEDMELFLEPPAGLNTTPGVIIDVINVGWAVTYEIKFDDGNKIKNFLIRSDYDARPLEPYQRVYVRLEPEHLMPYERADLL